MYNEREDDITKIRWPVSFNILHPGNKNNKPIPYEIYDPKPHNEIFRINTFEKVPPTSRAEHGKITIPRVGPLDSQNILESDGYKYFQLHKHEKGMGVSRYDKDGKLRLILDPKTGKRVTQMYSLVDILRDLEGRRELLEKLSQQYLNATQEKRREISRQLALIAYSLQDDIMKAASERELQAIWNVWTRIPTTIPTTLTEKYRHLLIDIPKVPQHGIYEETIDDIRKDVFFLRLISKTFHNNYHAYVVWCQMMKSDHGGYVPILDSISKVYVKWKVNEIIPGKQTYKTWKDIHAEVAGVKLAQLTQKKKDDIEEILAHTMNWAALDNVEKERVRREAYRREQNLLHINAFGHMPLRMADVHADQKAEDVEMKQPYFPPDYAVLHDEQARQAMEFARLPREQQQMHATFIGDYANVPEQKQPPLDP